MEHAGGTSDSLIEVAKNKLDLSEEKHYDGLYADSMRWCRGAILSAVRGLLGSQHVPARQHADAIALFERYLLREGLVNSRHASLVLRELQLGETSGDTTTAAVSEAESARLLAETKAFVRHAEHVLQESSQARASGHSPQEPFPAIPPTGTEEWVRRTVGRTTAGSPSRLAMHIAMPAGLFFHSGHTWASVDVSGEVRIGMDDFVQRVIGRLDRIRLPGIGGEVRQGERLFSVRQGRRAAYLVSPVEGTVRAVNEAVARQPETVKEDPYGAGWICTVFPPNLSMSLRKLRIAEEAGQWIRNEVLRLHSELVGQIPQLQAVGMTLHDGGVIIDGVLEGLGDEMWTFFRKDFLANVR